MSTTDPNRPHRQRMVDEQIRSRGITDQRVLSAMVQIPRERFVPQTEAAAAFSDQALAIGQGQTISQPYMVASMTQELNLQPQHRVLEIGTGSGYQTAILAKLAQHVYTIERLEPLQTAARQLLQSLEINNVSYRLGDGSIGWKEQAPFDGIIVTAGAPQVPQTLIDQLLDDGRLVIPVGGHAEQILTVVQRQGLKTIETPRYPCRFVKLIGKQAWKEPQ
ncbi:MAG: protein-L-isoaspartate(D-aspartate) O-methyltransferase [Planctomycetota bacterium]